MILFLLLSRVEMSVHSTIIRQVRCCPDQCAEKPYDGYIINPNEIKEEVPTLVVLNQECAIILQGKAEFILAG